MELLTFEEALYKDNGTKHLLLGNGFSIALCPNIFRYDSLFKNADFSGYPEIQGTFNSLESEDFEEVVEALERATTVWGNT